MGMVARLRSGTFARTAGLGFLLICLAATGTGLLPSGVQASMHVLASYRVVLRRDVAYGPLADETLDLCRPVGVEGARPGVVAIHGGGWSQGDKLGYDGYCAYFASLGFVAAAIDYRLAPRWRWPAQLVDAQLAVRWLRAHAGTLDLDRQRICAFGESAGAQLALFLGTLRTIHPGDEAGVLADQSPGVGCVVDEFGPADLTVLPFPVLFGGATLASGPGAYRDASPIFDVGPGSAPMLIVQGSRDMVVPPGQSLALESALKRAGVPVQYVRYAGGHAFTGQSAQQRDAIARLVGAWLVAECGR